MSIILKNKPLKTIYNSLGLEEKGKVQTFLEAIDADPDFENVVLPLPAGLSLGKRIR